jgi:transcriptional regulator with XRE-family HTH domain
MITEPEFNQALGRILRAQRTMLGISQDELGKLIGVTFQQIQKYENGINNPSPHRLMQLAEQLGMPVLDWLVQACAPAVPEVEELNRQCLEMMRRFRGLPAHERAAIHVCVNTLSAKGQEDGR